MRLKIFGDNPTLWQWDTGQKLIVEDNGICREVHFCNNYSDKALVLPIMEQDGIRVVDVPNILLQEASMLTAYLFSYDANGSETKFLYRFSVRPRPRPDSYIYTETEVLNYASIDKRLNYLEQNQLLGGGFIASDVAPEDTSVLWIDTDEDEVDNLQNIISEALAQAKASGEFNGKDGKDGYTPVKGVDYFDGKDGVDGKDGYTPQKGVDYFDGADGKDYVLTESDKQEIAELTAPLVDVPSGGGSNQPLTFTGAVNATYDGSEAVSVEIPQGGGGGGSAGWELINTFILEEDSNSVIIDKDSNGNSFDLSAFMLYIDRVASDLQTANGTLYIGNAPSDYFAAMHSQTAAQTRLWVQVEFACPHGYKAVQGNGASSNYGFTVSYAGNSQTHAPMLRLYNYYFGAGTKITFYGVRK